MSYGLLLVNEYRQAVEFSTKGIQSRADALSGVLKMAQAYSLQIHIHSALEQIGNDVAAKREHHYGVLIAITLHDCRRDRNDTRIPRFGGARVIGAGNNIQAAGRRYFEQVTVNGTWSAPGDCQLYLWKDPFGVSVVSLPMMGQAEPRRFEWEDADADPDEPCRAF
jgi:hypothetical protein